MGYVGAETESLARGGSTLAEVGSATRAAGTLLAASAHACAAALGGDPVGLDTELARLGAASAAYADRLGDHVQGTGWLADSLAGDLDRATGGS